MTTRRHRSARVLARAAVAARSEELERRTLLSFAPTGSEFRANSYTTGWQLAAAVGMDGDGDFIVTWQSDGQDGSAQGIYAQRYNAAGVAQGSEFRVNSTTPGPQGSPAVAVDADGDFVIAWDAFPSPGNPNSDIYAQRYNAAGVPQGAEFRVNTSTTGFQRSCRIAMDAAGNFVIVWQSTPSVAADIDIYAQRYNLAGVPQGAEFRVNPSTTLNQANASVAMDASGDFVVAWQSYEQEGSVSQDVYARRYDSAGAAQGGEFRVNTYTSSSQTVPSVAMDFDGDFVVAWSSFVLEPTPEDQGIYAQRFNSAGISQGSEFHVNTFTTSFQTDPSANMDADGDFIVTWSSLFQDGDGYGVYAQTYNTAGVAQGGEFRVNTYTTGPQRVPRVAMDHDGDAIVAWWSNGQDGSGYGVYAQRYDESMDSAGPVVAGVFVNGAPVLPYSVQQPAMQQIVVSFSENMNVSGANSVTDPANWLLTRNGDNITSDISSITFGFNAATNRYEAVLNLSTSHTSGNFLVQARDALRDANGNALDGNLDGAPGGSFAMPFSLPAFDNEFRVNIVNSITSFSPAVAMDADGDFVVVWYAGQLDLNVYAQRFNAAGVPQGVQFQVNTYMLGGQFECEVAMDDEGDFVVVWRSDGQDGSNGGVYARRYSASGAAQGGEFRVNTYTTGSQSSPAVATDADGDFVVVWHSVAQEGSYGIYGQRFDGGGVAQGVEFRVNSFTPGNQFSPAAAMDADGDFVVAWTSDAQDGSGSGVYAKRYNAIGAALGSEFRVNTFTTGLQADPVPSMAAGGDFVITWASEQDGSDTGIYAQRYNRSGAPQGAEFRANTFTTGLQQSPAVAMDDAGSFVVAWESFQDGDDFGIYAKQFDAAGSPRGSELRINNVTLGPQRFPAIAADADGDAAVSWLGDGVRVRVLLDDQQTPTVGSLADSPDPVPSGDLLTLNAGDVTDDGTVTSVSFYRESNGVVGLQVGFQGDTLIAVTLTPTGLTWDAAVSTDGLAPGTYTYWAQATDDAGLTGQPASTTNTVIPGVPAVTASSFNFATLPQRLSFTFDQNVGPSLGLDDVVVQQIPGGLTIVPNGLTYDTQTDTVTFTFNTAIPDGRFRARLIAAGISGPGGQLPADHFFEFTFLRGDANGDGRVNLQDFNVLAANFGQSPRDFTQGDFDYSGNVNLSDFNILAGRFGAVVGPTATDSARNDAGDEKLPDEMEELLG